MSEVIETIEGRHGWRVEIFRDDEQGAGNPREWDQLGKLGVWAEALAGVDELKFRRGFELDDLLEDPELDHGLEDAEGCSLVWDDFSHGDQPCDAIEDYFRREFGAVGPVIPLRVRHDWQSTLEAIPQPTTAGRAYTRDDWLDEAEGVIFATAERLEDLGVDNDDGEIRRQLVGEIREINAYLVGDVYAFRVVDPLGGERDSSYGFLDSEGSDYGGAQSAGEESLAGEIEGISEELAEANRRTWSR